MHPHVRHSAAHRDHRGAPAGEGHLATVTALADARRRRDRATHPRHNLPQQANTLSTWLLQFLAAVMDHGSIVRTSMTSISAWAELVSSAGEFDNIADRGCGHRIDVTPVETAQFAAIVDSHRLLTDLDANPRFDIEIACTANSLTLTLRGILADPVMTPHLADSITDTLQAAAGENHWHLDATDSGSLRWDLGSAYSAMLP